MFSIFHRLILAVLMWCLYQYTITNKTIILGKKLKSKFFSIADIVIFCSLLQQKMCVV